MVRGEIRLCGGEFRWDPAAPEPFLQQVHLQVAPGQLAVCVGTVGAGKSSLIMALLGEMHFKPSAASPRVELEQPTPESPSQRPESATGRDDLALQSVHSSELGAPAPPGPQPPQPVARGPFKAIKGAVAFAPQSPWIMRGTVRENILIGRRYDAARYNTVIDACALRSDLDALLNGDETVLEDPGALSGGQRQRLGIARCVYGEADCYVFDDPFSALDNATARHVFHAVVLGLLAQRTRFVVTHQLFLSAFADRVVLMRGVLTASEAVTRILPPVPPDPHSAPPHAAPDSDDRSSVSSLEANPAHLAFMRARAQREQQRESRPRGGAHARAVSGASTVSSVSSRPRSALSSKRAATRYSLSARTLTHSHPPPSLRTPSDPRAA
jgi:ABC-type lipoprotein export system ATPase subunit